METQALLNDKDVIYPFEWDGRKFQSRVSIDSELFLKAIMTGVNTFINFNKQCLDELVGQGNDLNFIVDKLVEINKGGSVAFIELAEVE